MDPARIRRRPGGREAGLRVAEGCAGAAGGQPPGGDSVADGSHSVDQGAVAGIHWDPLGSTGTHWDPLGERIQSLGFKGKRWTSFWNSNSTHHACGLFRLFPL